ncbi:hypothetical protein [Rhizobium terrae]|uniref:hypothetical protein n=1 Tax=Rhizobium terrae TaxID=2171756 RepID=UPI000E3D7519|nr:hypothetical protein [Rhizobium terrae]
MITYRLRRRGASKPHFARPVRRRASGEKTLADFEALAQQANVMLDDLVWWTNVLKAGRS